MGIFLYQLQNIQYARHDSAPCSPIGPKCWKIQLESWKAFQKRYLKYNYDHPMFWAYLHPWSKVDTLSRCKQSNIIGKRRSNIHGFVICSDQGPLHVELFLLWLDNERVCIGTCRDVTSMVVTGSDKTWIARKGLQKTTG